MQKMINFKKMLTTFGLLTMVAPAWLNVIACGNINIVKEDKVIEKYHLDSGNIRGLTHLDDNLYATSTSGTIWEINLESDLINQKYNLDDQLITVLVHADNGNLYVGTGTGSIWEINLATNQVEEKYKNFQENETIQSLIQADNGKLYAGNDIGNVWEFDLNNDAEQPKQYSFEDTGRVYGLVQADNGNLYASLRSGSIWEINLKNNEISQVYQSETDSFSRITQGLDNQLIIGRMGQTPGKSDIVLVFDLETKAIIKEYDLDDSIVWDFYKIENELFIGTTSGLWKVDLMTAEVTKANMDQANDVISLDLVNDKLYAGGTDIIYEMMI